MKNIVLTAIFCLLCDVVSSQTNCEQDSDMYLAAFNHILNDSVNLGKIIAVSDSIVDLDRFWFSENLEDYPKEKEIINQYRMNKKYIWFDTFYSVCLDSLFCNKKVESPSVILFFSQIENNILRADVLPYRNKYVLSCEKFNYNKMAFQTVGNVYLFIFNANGAIKLTLQREIIYD